MSLVTILARCTCMHATDDSYLLLGFYFKGEGGKSDIICQCKGVGGGRQSDVQTSNRGV